MITEGEINKILQKSLALHFIFKAKGQNKNASLILQIGSMIADNLLKISGIRKNYTKFVKCKTCEMTITHPIDREFAIKSGECLMCDKLRGDIMLEQETETEKIYAD